MSTTHSPTEAGAPVEPEQTFGTEGIKPMLRPSLVTRVFMGIVAGAERLNLKLSKVGNPAVYDNAVFP